MAILTLNQSDGDRLCFIPKACDSRVVRIYVYVSSKKKGWTVLLNGIDGPPFNKCRFTERLPTRSCSCICSKHVQHAMVGDRRYYIRSLPTYSLPSTARLSREVGSHRTTSTFTSSINLTNNHTTTIPTTTIINYSMLAQAAIAFHEPVAR